MIKIADEMAQMKQDLIFIKDELGSYELELVDDIENRLMNIQQALYASGRHPMYISIIYSGKGGFEHRVAHDMFSALKEVDALMQKYWLDHLKGTDEKNILPILYEKDGDQIKVVLSDDDDVIEIE